MRETHEMYWVTTAKSNPNRRSIQKVCQDLSYTLPTIGLHNENMKNVVITR